jgi:nitroreductase
MFTFLVMEFSELVNSRHSVRAFKDKKLDNTTIRSILNTINNAPSAGNLQAYWVTVVQEEEVKRDIARAALDQMFIADAPAVFVFSADQRQAEMKYGDRGRELYALQDATIAASYCQLAAADLGLGSVWVGAFDPLEISRLIKADEYEVPIAIIPVGYSDEEPEKSGRKTLDEIVRMI